MGGGLVFGGKAREDGEETGNKRAFDGACE